MNHSELLEAILVVMRPLMESHGFREVARDVSNGYAMVRYENTSTALQVAFDWAEFRAFLEIGEKGVSIVSQEKNGLYVVGAHRRVFDVDDLLKVRGAHPSPVGKLVSSPRGIEIEPVKQLLAEYVEALESYAKDVLDGDFSVFEALDRRVDERLRLFQNWRS